LKWAERVKDENLREVADGVNMPDKFKPSPGGWI
jgi:hypothetical protein